MTADIQRGLKCPECGNGHMVPFTRDEERDYDLGDGETIKISMKDVPLERCDSCGLIAHGPAAAKVEHEAICRAVGLLTPSEIKAIREKFGWSQQYLADLTGLGVATISRCERGRLVANQSTNKILQAIRDCPQFRDYLERLLAAKTRKQEAGPAGGGSTPLPVNRVFRQIKQEAYAGVEFSLRN
jgi:putative zinc finger/helix-turn-helix YgiT family protein